jgi:hypothetical protein
MPFKCIFISSSDILNKLYYTRFYLATSFGSVKSHHQAINKIYKNGNPVSCFIVLHQQRCLYPHNLADMFRLALMTLREIVRETQNC